MRYSALRLETLALHVVLKAGLPTDHLGPIHQAEVAAWNWFKGYYRVVGVQVRRKIKYTKEQLLTNKNRNGQINKLVQGAS